MAKFLQSVIAAAMLVATVNSAFAQNSVENPSEQDIIKALTKRSGTGGNIPGRRSAKDIFGKRGVTTDEIEPEVPSINMRVNFAYDSDRLENEALLSLNTLGRALSDQKLVGQTFEIVGHTDAKGSDEYNDDLSERRAAAVVSYLVSNFGLDRARISSRGMGKRQLLDAANAFDEVNRRVEIRNVSGGD
jgi:outer membrane protein OmpA-like peptidoglycan-associated protein